MIRDLQDDHHGSLEDFLLRHTSKFVILGCLGMREKYKKKRTKESSSRLKEKGHGR